MIKIGLAQREQGETVAWHQGVTRQVQCDGG